MTVRVLVSYHYHRGTDLDALVAALGGDVELFADSGAYSAATKGSVIPLPDYAAWLNHWSPLLKVKANLDVIGDAAATAANQQQLEDAGHHVLPVFHANEPWSALEAICARHPYAALGGLALHAVGRRREAALMAWLARAFRIATAAGTVFHAFGVTSARIVAQLPFYSLDSSSYMFAQRWGLIYAWDARAASMRSIHLRNPRELARYARVLAANGLAAGRLSDPQFMRAGGETAAADRQYVCAGVARAYQLMESSLTRCHQVPPPPGQHGVGTKVFLALAGDSPADLAPLRRASILQGAC